ncbi:MAG: peptidase M14, partial [Proteobacteria bacterium]|nr:peptidase M14 [Pseudomonadota bacterium]
QLESLRKKHLQQKTGTPLVLWMGYSVHGNEASGSNAAMLFAWYLAAAKDPQLEEQLKNSVIILEPSINPDGLDRFASWVNANRSQHLIADFNDREHNEPWPGGRTNHYWFDLNRDWLLLQQPESRARVAAFHQWRPHVTTDVHEQGREAQYFFQPGVPSRQNPLTPGENFELTRELGSFHAAALDQAGKLYFTRESFDDFYYGKGSTYPDINGSIGILFEQPTARGHLAETQFGQRTFADGIANHLTTSLSTLRGSWAIRDKLKNYQHDFNARMQRQAKQVTQSGWVIADDGDAARMQDFLDILAGHQITALPLAESITIGKIKYPAGHSWFLPVEQANAGLLMALLDVRTSFNDNTFYDVSAWTLPEAFNLPWEKVFRAPKTNTTAEEIVNSVPSLEHALALILTWSDQNAPKVLTRLLNAGYRVRSAGKPFQISADDRLVSTGDLIINLHQLDTNQRQELFKLLANIQKLTPLSMTVIDKGYAATGVDLGSGAHKLIELPRPLLWIGEGVSGYAAGEVWHLLDNSIGLAPVRVNARQLEKIELVNYSHLLMVDGKYPENEKLEEKITAWVKAGGVLVAARRAASWSSKLFAEETVITENEKPPENETVKRRTYADFENDHAEQIVGGAIVETLLDLSHPLSFGYPRERLAMMRNGTTLLEAAKTPYSTVAWFSKKPLVSGYMGSVQQQEISAQPAVIADRQGDGLVVRFANNPNFRGYFKGSMRLYINSLFLSGMVEKTQIE